MGGKTELTTAILTPSTFGKKKRTKKRKAKKKKGEEGDKGEEEN